MAALSGSFAVSYSLTGPQLRLLIVKQHGGSVTKRLFALIPMICLGKS
jgi:hypothetical protein